MDANKIATDTPDEIAVRIAEIIDDHTGRQATPTSRLVADLSLDSLDLVDLAMSLESAYQIDIPDAEWEKAGDKSVADLAAMVAAKLAAKKAVAA